MRLYVRTQTGVVGVDVDETTASVQDVMIKIETKAGLPVAKQKLMYAGKPLDLSTKLSTIDGVSEGTVFDLVMLNIGTFAK